MLTPSLTIEVDDDLSLALSPRLLSCQNLHLNGIGWLTRRYSIGSKIVRVPGRIGSLRGQGYDGCMRGQRAEISIAKDLRNQEQSV